MYGSKVALSDSDELGVEEGEAEGKKKRTGDRWGGAVQGNRAKKTQLTSGG